MEDFYYYVIAAGIAAFVFIYMMAFGPEVVDRDLPRSGMDL